MARASASASIIQNLGAGIDTTVAALTVMTADGFQFDNTGREWVVIHNADASSHYATVLAPGTDNGADFSPETLTVAAGKYIHFGMFSKGAFNNGGKVQIDPEVGEHEHLYYKVLRANNLA